MANRISTSQAPAQRVTFPTPAQGADSEFHERSGDHQSATPGSGERHPARRSAGAFASAKGRRTYWLILIGLIVAGLAFAFGLLAYGNPMPVGTEAFWLLAERRMNAVIAIAIVALCQSLATVAFHTVTNNRIITPSIMGFESLYVALHTATVYFLGVAGLDAGRSTPMYLAQIGLMVIVAVMLYGWLLTGKHGNMHSLLLVGIVMGAGLGSISTFLQRMLTPSEFDVLTARLFGSVSNADPAYFPISLVLVGLAAVGLLAMGRRLNVMSLGPDATTNLGLNHRRTTILVLVLVTVLMAVSTALVGPMTFLGFLVATLAYQFAGTHDHRFVFPMAFVTAFVVLTSAYFVMNHIFYAQGVVSIIIELVGGSLFLYVILRKGKL